MIDIPLIECSKEYIFQFDLKNANDWDDYQITQNGDNSFQGLSNGCSSRIPIIFKKICVDYNHIDGYTLQFKDAENHNLDPNYDDLLWYYGDHETAKDAEKVCS